MSEYFDTIETTDSKTDTIKKKSVVYFEEIPVKRISTV